MSMELVEEQTTIEIRNIPRSQLLEKIRHMPEDAFFPYVRLETKRVVR